MSVKKGETLRYVDGVNLDRLRTAMYAIGLSVDQGAEEFAASIADNVNALTFAVVKVMGGVEIPPGAEFKRR